jgi:ribonuclease P/MRP protein subunit POP5
MTPLPKHLRPRHRYLAVGLAADPEADIDRRAFQQGIWYAAQNLLGDVGSAALDLSVLQFAFADGTGEAVVRTRRGEVDRTRAVLACLDGVEDQPVGLRVRGTSGTVRACEATYLS